MRRLLTLVLVLVTVIAVGTLGAMRVGDRPAARVASERRTVVFDGQGTTSTRTPRRARSVISR